MSRPACSRSSGMARAVEIPKTNMRTAKSVAEREGFEPPIPLRVCRISSAVLSTTQPPLRSPKPASKRPGMDGRYLTKHAKTDKGRTAYIAIYGQHHQHGNG